MIADQMLRHIIQYKRLTNRLNVELTRSVRDHLVGAARWMVASHP